MNVALHQKIAQAQESVRREERLVRLIGDCETVIRREQQTPGWDWSDLTSKQTKVDQLRIRLEDLQHEIRSTLQPIYFPVWQSWWEIAEMTLPDVADPTKQERLLEEVYLRAREADERACWVSDVLLRLMGDEIYRRLEREMIARFFKPDDDAATGSTAQVDPPADQAARTFPTTTATETPALPGPTLNLFGELMN